MQKGGVLETSPLQKSENKQSSNNSTEPTQNQTTQTSTEYESPAAVFSTLHKASAANDLPAALKCMDAESQKMMASMTSLPLALMTIDPEKQESIKELMSNHGISLEEPHDEFSIETEKGPIAFIVDVQNWMEKNADTFESQEKAPLRQMADASRWKVAEYVKFLIVSLRKLHT